LLVLLLSSCTALTAASEGPCPGPSFENRSSIQESFLRHAWGAAQKKVAEGGVVLNAVAYQFYGAAKQASPPEPRALDIQPCRLLIVAEPEVPASELNRLPGCQSCPYSDPTGIIRCSGSPTGYCRSFTVNYSTIHLPASNPLAAEWEFMTVILDALGYDAGGM
jgi:hypothetical protein